MSLTLGLDIGTTRTKALLLDTATAQTVAVVSTATPVTRSDDGDLRDPEQVWHAIVGLLADLRGQGAPVHLVTGVSAAAVGEEIVFLDARGAPTGPIPCWYVEHSAAVDDPDAPPHALASWYAIRAASAAGALDAATTFTDLGSWVLLRIAGSAAAVTDRTHASRTGLLDATEGTWSPARLASCGIAHLQPPELVDSGARIGEACRSAAAELGIPAGTPVHAGAHDHLCAAVAAGVNRSGDVFLSVGTSETQLMLVDLPWSELAALERPDLEIGHFADGRHRYLHAARPSGRRVADLVADDPSGRDVGAVYTALGTVTAEVDGVTTLRAEADDRDATAARLFRELRRQAREAAGLTVALETAAGRPAERIRIAGSPTRHELWRRVRQQDALRPVEFVTLDEPSAVGAALLAGPHQIGVDA